MKRLCCVVFSLLLVFWCMAGAFAAMHCTVEQTETGYFISPGDTDSSIDSTIVEISEDIPSGTYLITFDIPASGLTIRLYKRSDMHLLYHEEFTARPNKLIFLTLSDQEVLFIDDGPITLTPFSPEEAALLLPEGAVIPPAKAPTVIAGVDCSILVTDTGYTITPTTDGFGSAAVGKELNAGDYTFVFDGSAPRLDVAVADFSTRLMAFGEYYEEPFDTPVLLTLSENQMLTVKGASLTLTAITPEAAEQMRNKKP